MTDMRPTRPTAGPQFELRPSPNRHLNADAPDEIVLTDGKKRGFGEFLDIVNPLQHLPIVGSIYRAVTGSTIEPSARIIGGLLYGGPIGMASAFVNTVVEETSGRDIGGHALAAVGIGGAQGGNFPQFDPAALTAQNVPPPPSAQAVASGEPGRGGVQFASFGAQDARIERTGLLATWIAGSSAAFAQSAPAPLQPAAAAVAATAPIQSAAAEAPTGRSRSLLAPAGPPNAETSAGRSLVDYRVSAINVPTSMRSPGPVGPTGISRNMPHPSQTAALRTAEISGSNVVHAQTQRGEPSDADSFFSAQMAAGLERYARLQRERGNPAREPDIRRL